MFERARRRLALRYVALIGVILIVFSLVLFGVLVVVLQPAFDIVPEAPNDVASRQAYVQTLQRVAVALVVADGVVLAVVGAIADHLAGRTLRPIREAHERQRRFVADASHEMRTPLSIIRSTAESSLARGGDGRDHEQALQIVVGASERLSALTNDLLLLARSEQGRIDRRRERVDLSVTAAEAVDAVRRSNRDAPPWNLSLTPDLAVEGDPEEIARIVENLLVNAVRHGGLESPIGVRTLRLDGAAVVEVADHGPGLAVDELDRIFEPFYRVRADSDAPPGTGLGLAIASELARRNGGRLSVESQPGAGATFRLHLRRLR